MPKDSQNICDEFKSTVVCREIYTSRFGTPPESKPLRFTTTIPEPPYSGHESCISCRIIGLGALGAGGVYALVSSRASTSNSVVGKRIVAAVGFCEYRFFICY